MTDYIKVFNTGMTQTLGMLSLSDCQEAEVQKDIYGTDIFSFYFTIQDDTSNKLKNQILTKGNLLEIPEPNNTTQLYVITRTNKKREAGKCQKIVECEQIQYALIEDKLEYFKCKDYTIIEILDALKITTFSFEINLDHKILATKIDMNKNNTNTKEVLLTCLDQIAKTANVPKIPIYFFKNICKIGSFWANHGASIILGKNIQNCEAEIDEYNNTFYSIDLVELENAIGTEGSDFANLDSINLSDFVRLKDVELEVDETLQVLAYTYNPFYKKLSTVQLGMIRPGLSDQLVTTGNLAHNLQDQSIQDVLKNSACWVKNGNGENHLLYEDGLNVLVNNNKVLKIQDNGGDCAMSFKNMHMQSQTGPSNELSTWQMYSTGSRLDQRLENDLFGSLIFAHHTFSNQQKVCSVELTNGTVGGYDNLIWLHKGITINSKNTLELYGHYNIDFFVMQDENVANATRWSFREDGIYKNNAKVL